MSEYSLSFWLVLLIGLHALICDQKKPSMPSAYQYFDLLRGFLSGIHKDKERGINRP